MKGLEDYKNAPGPDCGLHAPTLPLDLALLLGGRSRRMGVPKHTLRRAADGVTLLQHQLDRLSPHFQRVWLLSGDHQVEYPHCLPDPAPYQGEGPLAGLLAALGNARGEWVALAAVDQPQLDAQLYRYALDHADPTCEAVILQDREGRSQWLCGLYRTRLKTRLETELTRGERAVKRFAAALRVRELPLPEELDHQTLINVNTPQEAEAAGFGEWPWKPT